MNKLVTFFATSQRQRQSTSAFDRLFCQQPLAIGNATDGFDVECQAAIGEWDAGRRSVIKANENVKGKEKELKAMHETVCSKSVLAAEVVAELRHVEQSMWSACAKRQGAANNVMSTIVDIENHCKALIGGGNGEDGVQIEVKEGQGLVEMEKDEL